MGDDAAPCLLAADAAAAATALYADAFKRDSALYIGSSVTLTKPLIVGNYLPVYIAAGVTLTLRAQPYLPRPSFASVFQGPGRVAFAGGVNFETQVGRAEGFLSMGVLSSMPTPSCPSLCSRLCPRRPHPRPPPPRHPALAAGVVALRRRHGRAAAGSGLVFRGAVPAHHPGRARHEQTGHAGGQRRGVGDAGDAAQGRQRLGRGL